MFIEKMGRKYGCCFAIYNTFSLILDLFSESDVTPNISSPWDPKRCAILPLSFLRILAQAVALAGGAVALLSPRDGTQTDAGMQVGSACEGCVCIAAVQGEMRSPGQDQALEAMFGLL